LDIVQLSDGALRIGINQWPDAGDGGPRSTAGMITEDPEAASGNWVFFAVTYDSAQPFAQVNYYFGKPDQAAQLDVSADYDRGPVLQTGPLTIGNFSSVASARNETGPNGGSRVFRGLIDEVKVFNEAYSIDQIRSVQKAAVQQPVASPTLSISRSSENQVALSWESSGAFQLQSRDALNAGSWTDVATIPVVDGNRSTVVLPLGNNTQFYRLRSK
jgi:hypothetical protein